MKTKFRTPEEIADGKGGKVMISIRLRESLLSEIDKMAEKAGITRTDLLESVLTEYVFFVKGARKK